MTTKKPLDILIVEDNPLHQASARYTLAEHNVTIVKTFFEAERALSKVGVDIRKLQLGQDPFVENSAYDAVLTDTIMCNGDDVPIVGNWTKMAYSFPLALLAAQGGRDHNAAKYVAVVNDMARPTDPVEATFDYLQTNENNPPFKINDSIVGFFDTYFSPKLFVLRDGGFLPESESPWAKDSEGNYRLSDKAQDKAEKKIEKKLIYAPWDEEDSEEPIGKYQYAVAKNWGAALERLINYKK